jgi:hypothetical protein
MKVWTTIAVIWVASSAAIIAGMYLTKSAWCLWAFLIPGSIRITSGKDQEEQDNG